MISENTIQELREIDLVDIIGNYVDLKKRNGSYVGLCPFHDEKTPSFNVTPNKGFYCFGCGSKGKNAIDFIMLYENKTFSDAVIFLAGASNIFGSGNSVSVSHALRRKKQETTKTTSQASYVSFETFKASLIPYEGNYFIKYLIQLFGIKRTQYLKDKYFIGSSNRWPGATVFWQVDINKKVRTGHIMLYDQITGKRIKEPYNHNDWAHTALKIPDFNLKSCLFGEHLLTDKSKTVAIVESEKTAIISSEYLPEFIWLACSGKDKLTANKFEALRRRNIVLFPDVNAFELWHSKAKEITSVFPDINITMSDLLERKATKIEKEKGLDIADYLVRFDIYNFLKTEEQDKIFSTDIFCLLGETHTPREFNNIIMRAVKTNSGKIFDVLFNAHDELIKPDEQAEAVKRIAAFFDKNLVAGYFDNNPCLIHKYN